MPAVARLRNIDIGRQLPLLEVRCPQSYHTPCPHQVEIQLALLDLANTFQFALLDLDIRFALLPPEDVATLPTTHSCLRYQFDVTAQPLTHSFLQSQLLALRPSPTAALETASIAHNCTELTIDLRTCSQLANGQGGLVERVQMAAINIERNRRIHLEIDAYIQLTIYICVGCTSLFDGHWLHLVVRWSLAVTQLSIYTID